MITQFKLNSIDISTASPHYFLNSIYILTASSFAAKKPILFWQTLMHYKTLSTFLSCEVFSYDVAEVLCHQIDGQCRQVEMLPLVR